MSQDLCNESNIGPTLKFISGELLILGYSEINYEEENEKKALIELLNITQSLIMELKRIISKENNRNFEIAKFKSQIEKQNKEKTRMEKLLDKERNTCTDMKESLEAAKSSKKCIEIELKKQKVEIKNLKKSIEYNNLLHGKEILSKKTTIADLKSKLVMYVNDENINTNERLVLPNSLRLNKSNRDVEKYICSLNNNIQVLILENANIRNLVLKMFLEFSKDYYCRQRIDEHDILQNLLDLPGQDFVETLEFKLENISKEKKQLKLVSNS